MNFKRHANATGWTFSTLIVIIGSKVACKQWSGSPNIADETATANPPIRLAASPLHRLQGIGTQTRGSVKAAGLPD